MNDKWVVNSDHTEEVFIAHARKLYQQHKYVEFSIKAGAKRTNPQNAALHVYLKQVADAFNAAGLDMKQTLSADIDTPWTALLVKELIWKVVQKATIDETSTTKANRTDYTLIYETINRHTASTWGISIPWPTKEQSE
ncbi:MAG: hypothetical protein JKY52_09210 [Flavobacteriales bacterium]|nr:hypothetical protein [Flavobacteriales bacterium]